MCHPLGELHSLAPAITLYGLGNQAMHRALRYWRQGDAGRASDEFHTAARAAITLARFTGTSDPERAAHWTTVSYVRRAWAEQARAAIPAAPVGV